MGRFTILMLFSLLNGTALAEGQMCSYFTYSWNVYIKKPVAMHKVVKPKYALSAEEYDQISGCSVCVEDQVTLTIGNLPPFKVCKKISAKIEMMITGMLQQGAPLTDVVGYRVGRTRGAIDADGNRTGFSNHSFGVALDINTAQNGLYDNCETFGYGCRLIKGGAWDPSNAFSLTVDSLIVRTFKSNGFHWGGEIAGKQKDFMHFSLTGY